MRFVAGKLLWGKGRYEYDFLLSMLSSLNGLTNYFLINACKEYIPVSGISLQYDLFV